MDLSLATSERMSSRIFDIPNLDEGRERELLLRAHSSNPDDNSRAALTELWMSHGKLVSAIAARYRRSDIGHGDLINAGHLGLHTAITRFDTTRFDTRLAAYAAIWIRCYIHDYIRRNTGPVRLPESKGHRQLAQCGPRLMIEARNACLREGVYPADSELHERVGRRVGLSAGDVARGLRLIQGASASLNLLDQPDGEENTLTDEAAITADDVIERLDHDRLRSRLRALANEVLGERERQVFLERSMANSDQVPSLELFATRFGVSATRVHQIEVSARRKISAALATTGYGEFAEEGAIAHLAQVRARRGAGPGGRAGYKTPSARYSVVVTPMTEFPEAAD